MTPPVYVSSAPSQLLGTYPRAVYRITVARAGLSQLSFASGLLRWPDVVESTVSAIGRSGYGIPLGYPAPSLTDEVAVFEVRAPSSPSSGDSVGDLVRVADDASNFTRVTRIERLAPVPGFTDTVANQNRAATRDAEVARAAMDDTRSPLAALASLGGRIQWTVGVALTVSVVVLALYFLAPFRKVSNGS